MHYSTAKVSANFRKMTLKAILSIVLFIVVYLLLIVFSLALIVLCCYGGLMLVIAKAGLYSIIAAGGLVSVGILVLVFIFKFLFKEHVVDRSHLIEISAEQQPKLFEFINAIVKEINTGFPKKIYISSDVNASVFYDSGFWSMFLPVKKNLQLGLGLINTVSKEEFKAILSHEFGHFSQRSMKVGSYVYNVNQVIFNMLYDNKSFDLLAQSWASVSKYFAFFVAIAFKIVKGIQWVLSKMYKVVNLSYMGLSREMEFHADEVAAGVAGSKPLINSLLRMDLCDMSYNMVLNFYNAKIGDAKKTKNIFVQQQFVLSFLASEHGLPLENNLPLVNQDHLSRYNKSKLNINNQWASHPSTTDRVKELTRLNIIKETNDKAPASDLFINMNELQAEGTKKIFASVKYQRLPVDVEDNAFIEEFSETYKGNSFAKLFNNYYDNKNLPKQSFENKSSDVDHTLITPDSLFDDKAVDLVYTALSLESDINILNQIANGNYKIKSFDYDGKKYAAKLGLTLVVRLDKELKEIQKLIKENDQKIYHYFLSLAIKCGQQKEFKLRYDSFTGMDEEYDRKSEIYFKIANAADFMQHTNPVSVIEKNMAILKKIEPEFKEHIDKLVESGIYQSVITEELRKAFIAYISKNQIYFKGAAYDNKAVEILFTAMNNFQAVLAKSYFNEKKSLLNYFEGLHSSRNEIK